MVSDSPLGKKTDYPDTYAPGLLHPIDRGEARRRLGIGLPLPFDGVDVWTAWELTWLDERGVPQVATASITIPASSANIVESKSLKLYLNSFAMSRFASAESVAERICGDLSDCVGADADLAIQPVNGDRTQRCVRLPGASVDDQAIDCNVYDVDPLLLAADPDDVVDEQLHSHLLRSLCPVTAQPDIGSVLVDYSGPRINRAALLRYIVSYRKHEDFHEACVERMFTDLIARCGPQRLTVYARYQRRGGIDINPYRSSDTSAPPPLRLWRQ